MSSSPPFLDVFDEDADLIWAKNVGASTIDSFGLVIVSGATTIGNQVVLEVEQPDDDNNGMVNICAVNGPTPIKVNRLGKVTMTWPTIVRYDTANTPAANVLWGPQSGDYALKQGNNGMLAISGAISTDPPLALFDHQSHYHKPMWLRCSLDSALATTDATTTNFTVEERWGGYTSGPSDPTTINNVAAASNYIFAGEEDAVFLAVYDWKEDEYHIVQMECSNECQ